MKITSHPNKTKIMKYKHMSYQKEKRMTARGKERE
jgi:hypothetical protein